MRQAAQYDQPGASGLAGCGLVFLLWPGYFLGFLAFPSRQAAKSVCLLLSKKLILEPLCDFYTPDIRAATIKLSWLYIIDNNIYSLSVYRAI
ncbi:hypothetical protein M5585_04290 [Serratia ureilytica]